MSQSHAGRKSPRKKFVNDKIFDGFAKPKMVRAATDMLSKDEVSEEAFLGAQAVLMLNGVL